MSDDRSVQIQEQMKLLETHRRTLGYLLQQRAKFTHAYVPPHVTAGIQEARNEIYRIKETIREWKVNVEDEPSDIEPKERLPIDSTSSLSLQEIILVIGSGVIENVLQVEGEVKLNHKHIVERKELLGGSGINYTMRLANTGHNVLPILSVGNDNAGHKVQRSLLQAARSCRLHQETIQFIEEKDFLCSGIQTNESVVVVSNVQRTIFTGEVQDGTSFKEFVLRQIGSVKKRMPSSIKAVMIGHIHADHPKHNPNCPGEITKEIIKEFRDKCLVFTNFGEGQIAKGPGLWKNYWQHINIFQLSLEETRRFFRTDNKYPSLVEIISNYQSNNITAIITLDKFGAIATFKNDRRIIFAWPIEIPKLVDTTGAGDAFGAGLISELYRDAPITFSKFQRAIETARIWAAYACTKFGGANDCPSNQALEHFKQQVEEENQLGNSVEARLFDDCHFLLRLLDKAY